MLSVYLQICWITDYNENKINWHYFLSDPGAYARVHVHTSV